MSVTLLEINQSVQPILRDIAYQNELLKSFKETDEEYLGLQQKVKEANDAAKAYLEENDDSKEILEKIEELSDNLKSYIDVAAQHFEEFSKKDLKAYFVARSKEKVEDVITKGDTFERIDEVVGK
jgi:hypothetical protein